MTVKQIQDLIIDLLIIDPSPFKETFNPPPPFGYLNIPMTPLIASPSPTS